MLAKTLEINWHDGQAIYSADFSPDGSRYATAGADNSVRVSGIISRKQRSNTHFIKKKKLDLEYSQTIR